MKKVSSVNYEQAVRGVQAGGEIKKPRKAEGSFKQELGQQIDNNIKFSKHAMERISSRGINLDKKSLENLQNAVDKASGKGIKDSLVMMDDTALIVSIRNKTVVTAMSKESLKQNVVTNVDGVVVI